MADFLGSVGRSNAVSTLAGNIRDERHRVEDRETQAPLLAAQTEAQNIQNTRNRNLMEAEQKQADYMGERLPLAGIEKSFQSKAAFDVYVNKATEQGYLKSGDGFISRENLQKFLDSVDKDDNLRFAAASGESNELAGKIKEIDGMIAKRKEEKGLTELTEDKIMKEYLNAKNIYSQRKIAADTAAEAARQKHAKTAASRGEFGNIVETLRSTMPGLTGAQYIDLAKEIKTAGTVPSAANIYESARDSAIEGFATPQEAHEIGLAAVQSARQGFRVEDKDPVMENMKQQPWYVEGMHIAGNYVMNPDGTYFKDETGSRILIRK